MRNLICFLLIGLLIQGCASQKITRNEQTLLLQLSIDSALKLDPNLNTPNYWIDVSNPNLFSKKAINDFLEQHNNFTQVNADSLIKHDTTWKEYGYLEKMLIIVNSVEFKGDSVIISLDKIRAKDGANGIKIILQKIKKEYEVISSEITWIS